MLFMLIELIYYVCGKVEREMLDGDTCSALSSADSSTSAALASPSVATKTIWPPAVSCWTVGLQSRLAWVDPIIGLSRNSRGRRDRAKHTEGNVGGVKGKRLAASLSVVLWTGNKYISFLHIRLYWRFFLCRCISLSFPIGSLFPNTLTDAFCFVEMKSTNVKSN